MGKWLKVNGEGIYQSRCSQRKMKRLENGAEIRFTKKDNREYVFLDGLPEGQVEFSLDGYAGMLKPLASHITVERRVERRAGIFQSIRL